MINDVSMTIRTNKAVKNQAQSILAELGLDMSTAINIFMRQVIHSRGVPFEIKLEQPNAVTLQAMKEAEEINKNPGKYKTYSSVEEILDEVEE